MKANELPYISNEVEGTGGKIRASHSDFIVNEIPLYEPCGYGNHLYINATKQGLSTTDVQELITKALQINKRDIGFGGLKDKNAVTTQTFSVPVKAAGTEPIMLEKLKSIPIHINWTKLHKNKLRTGHLLGNSFCIRISSIEIPMDIAFERANKICELIKTRGIPNYFGVQRFGVEGNNAEKGLKILRGEIDIRDRWLRRFLISSLQSQMCNQYLAYRMETGNFNRLLNGDIAKKYETGGLFEVDDVEKEQQRYENKEISFTAPVYGPEMWQAKAESDELERNILEKNNVSLEDFGNAGAKGTRRLGRLIVNDIEVEKEPESLTVKFTLPKGAFATTVLREIMKKDEMK